jgi:ribosomal protein S18 acetylase RimI-like enzyme
MPEIEIRPVNPSDYLFLENLEHYYFTNYVWQMDRLIEDDQVSARFRTVHLPRQVRVEYPHSQELFKEGKRQYIGMLTALIGGTPVGYICTTEQLAASTAWIKQLVVQERLRRKGIGTALVLAAQEWAIQKKYRKIVLEMQSKNYPAIQMCKKIGFEFCGYNDQYYLNQDIVVLFTRLLR